MFANLICSCSKFFLVCSSFQFCKTLVNVCIVAMLSLGFYDLKFQIEFLYPYPFQQHELQKCVLDNENSYRVFLAFAKFFHNKHFNTHIIDNKHVKVNHLIYFLVYFVVYSTLKKLENKL